MGVFFKEGKTCKSKCYTYSVLGVLFLEDFSLVRFMYHCHVFYVPLPCHLSCILCTIAMSFVMYFMYQCHVICHVLCIRLLVFVEYLHTENTYICLISEFGFKNKTFKVLYVVTLYLSKS